MKYINERKANALGHMLRWNYLVGNVIEGEIKVRKSGRQWMTVTDYINEGDSYEEKWDAGMYWIEWSGVQIIGLKHVSRQMTMNELIIQLLTFYERINEGWLVLIYSFHVQGCASKPTLCLTFHLNIFLILIRKIN